MVCDSYQAVMLMGKIRIRVVKRTARELLEKYPVYLHETSSKTRPWSPGSLKHSPRK